LCYLNKVKNRCFNLTKVAVPGGKDVGGSVGLEGRKVSTWSTGGVGGLVWVRRSVSSIGDVVDEVVSIVSAIGGIIGASVSVVSSIGGSAVILVVESVIGGGVGGVYRCPSIAGSYGRKWMGGIGSTTSGSESQPSASLFVNIGEPQQEPSDAESEDTAVASRDSRGGIGSRSGTSRNEGSSCRSG
jgi:hypothetical protein